MKINKIIYLVLILLLAAASNLEARKKTAKGIVFEDANRNGVFDKGETGIPGVSVSNQYEVVQSDKNGHFRLPVSKETILFVSKPAGYNTPVDKNNIPRFYYIHQPAGSPSGLKYKGIEPTGKLPKVIHFPLLKTKKDETFDVIIMGDPQTKTAQELSYYRDAVIAGLMGTKARFYIALGDILYDDLSLYDGMNRLVGQMGIPAYHVMGNHDMNRRVPDYIYEAETFKRTYGPDFYSFNYGKVHFVVLNTVKYKGWNKKENKPGSYTGYVHERQLTWLKNDLSNVPEDHLVVLTMHIPIKSDMYDNERTAIMNRAAFFKVLENRPHLLALAGHMHFVEHLEFSAKDGWSGSVHFPLLTAGAGCGSWWHGPKDPRGIPYGIGTDGSPNGYFLFTFKGNSYKYSFIPSGASAGKRMRINSPFGTLSTQELKDLQINVNIFAATPRAKVTFRLDSRPAAAMKRTVMKDPFFAQMVKENPKDYLKWMEPVPSSHIWVAPLPGDLAPGIHRLEITVKDQQGSKYSANRLFEVK